MRRREGKGGREEGRKGERGGQGEKRGEGRGREGRNRIEILKKN